MATGPVKLPALVMVRALGPSLTRPPEPLRVPLLMVKALFVELTVIPLGTTVPFTITLVESPGVSLNRTESPAIKTEGKWLAWLIQFAEMPVSQVPVLPDELQARFVGATTASRNNLDCLAFKETLKEPVTVAVVPSHKLVAI